MLLQLAVTPIIIFSGSYAVAQRWYEVIKRDISRYISKYEDCMHLIDGTPEQIAFVSIYNTYRLLFYFICL